MRKNGEMGNCSIWLSARDTYDWAHRSGASWPCSTLSGHRMFACVMDDDLVGFSLDGRTGADVDGAEVDAILADFGARGAR